MDPLSDSGCCDESGGAPGDQGRREFLRRMAGFTAGALGWLSFPGPARAADGASTNGGRPGYAEDGGRFDSMVKAVLDGPFPGCDPFKEYSGGKNCEAAYVCQTTFHCAGGVFDDFECISSFDCSQGLFQCSYSFDNEDCEAGYHPCTGALFNCTSGFNTP